MHDNRYARMVRWEIRDPLQNVQHIMIDKESIDDRLYLLRRLEDAAMDQSQMPAQVRFLGPVL